MFILIDLDTGYLIPFWKVIHLICYLVELREVNKPAKKLLTAIFFEKIMSFSIIPSNYFPAILVPVNPENLISISWQHVLLEIFYF